MKLHVVDEFSPLKEVAVCMGTEVPLFEDYQTDDPQEHKWEIVKWDKQLLLKQQDAFFNRLSSYGVELNFIETDPALWWQMYTRDVGFVLGDNLYFSKERTLRARNGEVVKLFKSLSLEKEQVRELDGKIEGGDVLCGSTAFVGISNRTTVESFTKLAEYYPAKPFNLGDNIMHLDCRMTLLPKKHILIYPDSFSREDWDYLQTEFSVIIMTKSEADALAGNVFIVNPETIFVEKSQKRIQDLLRDEGFNVEVIDYTEPVALGGSFRCTTLPLVRS